MNTSMRKENIIKIDRYYKISNYPQVQESIFEDDLLFADALIMELYRIKEGGYIKFVTEVSTFGLIISNFYFYYDHKKESDRKFLFAKKTFRQLFDGLFELTILYSKKEYVFNSD